MATFTLRINGKKHQVDASPDTPLLWVLRDHLGMVGTKYGCGIARCGACTVHIDGEPMRACSLPVEQVSGKSVTTIEGLSDDGTHPVQLAWKEMDVPQCGYCQAGQIMTAVAFLRKNPKPADEEIDQAMSDHICRCSTYLRIRKAVRTAASKK